MQDFQRRQGGPDPGAARRPDLRAEARTGEGDPRGPAAPRSPIPSRSAAPTRPGIASSEAQVDSAAGRAHAPPRRAGSRIEPLLQRGVMTQSQADQARAALDQADGVPASGPGRARGLAAGSHLDPGRAANPSKRPCRAPRRPSTSPRSTCRTRGSRRRRTAGSARSAHALGQYVSAGTSSWPSCRNGSGSFANFKETQLAGMEVGQPVTLHGRCAAARAS